MAAAGASTVRFEWDARDFDVLVESCERDEVTPYLFRYLPRHGTILEAGCGLGRYVAFLQARGYKVMGVEINPDSVAKVRARAPHLDVRQGDISALDLPEASVDGALSLGVVEHFPAGPGKPLTELLRVLKPGGILVVTVPCFNLVRRIKYHLGIFFEAVNPLPRLKRWSSLRRFMGKPPFSGAPAGLRRLRTIPFRYRHRHPLEAFHQYMFGPWEFPALLRALGFDVLVSAPVAKMDGLYRDLCRRWVRFENWRFYPTWPARAVNAVLSLFPFVHNHMQLCVAGKPRSKNPAPDFA